MEIPVIGQGKAPEELEVSTAYLVIVGLDGTVQLVHDIGASPKLILKRLPSLDDVQSSATIIRDNMVAQKTASAVQNFMMQASAAMMQKQQEAAVLAKIDESRARYGSR